MLSQYFAAKKKLYPQQVKGKIRSLKNWLNFLLLSIYIFSPYLRFNRGESAPNQAILIDFHTDVLYFFFIEIWPQEIYYLAGILVLSALLLFFITSLFGRVWCGYACFQTVWTDIFIAVERFWQGDRNSRILLDRKKNWLYYQKKICTHICWIAISLFTGLVFVSYFNDVFVLYQLIINLQLSTSILGWILGIGFATYLMAGFAREHVCTYMCPYARFQSAMFDNNTFVVSYQHKRGEPRQKYHQGDDFANRGHCIDCKQCVVVCPVGIDIRDGLQMQCIACGLCIDACDNIMEKFNLPKGLIRYDTLQNLNTNPDLFSVKKPKFFKPRTWYYLVIISAICTLIIFGLIAKQPIAISILQERNPLYVLLSDGSIRNVYQLSVTNKSHLTQKFFLTASHGDLVELTILNQENNIIELKPQAVSEFKIFLTAKNPPQHTESLVVDLMLSDQKQNNYKTSAVLFLP